MKPRIGIRPEFVDMTEVLRRIEYEIYDKEEYEKAYEWTREKCQEGFDHNKEEYQHTREQKEEEWKFIVKMTLIIRDIMLGNSRLKELGYYEESLGRNAIAGGFQGQRRSFYGCLFCYGKLGSKSWSFCVWTYRQRFNYIGFYAPYTSYA